VVSLFSDRRTLSLHDVFEALESAQRRKVYHTRVTHRAAVLELDIGAHTRLRAGDGVWVVNRATPARLAIRRAMFDHDQMEIGAE
jgi:hypothetical protein